jgi:thiosulfate/3-mercaptopyruvate sulfurtransferase
MNLRWERETLRRRYDIPMNPILRVEDLPPDAILLDARSAASYAEEHLAGARDADVDLSLSAARDPGADAARGGRHPLPPLDRWLRQLGEWGIDPSTHVVVYDDQAGANAAARAWWMLRGVGHERVSVLDGGLQAAIAYGFPVTTEAPSVAAQPPYPAEGWHFPTVDIDIVDAIRTNPDWIVLDVRSAPRFRGETEPIDPIAGHIPGAVNLPFAENLADGGFKSARDLRAMYDVLLDGRPAERLVVHCGSGVTACHTLLALEEAGLPGASLYVGSWGEWCRNPERPREP